MMFEEYASYRFSEQKLTCGKRSRCTMTPEAVAPSAHITLEKTRNKFQKENVIRRIYILLFKSSEPDSGKDKQRQVLLAVLGGVSKECRDHVDRVGCMNIYVQKKRDRSSQPKCEAKGESESCSKRHAFDPGTWCSSTLQVRPAMCCRCRWSPTIGALRSCLTSHDNLCDGAQRAICISSRLQYDAVDESAAWSQGSHYYVALSIGRSDHFSCSDVCQDKNITEAISGCKILTTSAREALGCGCHH